jgi:hypothetical protein
MKMNILDGILLVWNFVLVFYNSTYKEILNLTLNEILILVSIIYTIIRIFSFISDKYKNKK